VCAGKVAFARVHLGTADTPEFSFDHFITPASIDRITVDFDTPTEADAFQPPPWLGPEVTNDLAHETRSIALGGVPQSQEVTVSDAGLNALLDFLDNNSRCAAPIAGADSVRTDPRASVIESLSERHASSRVDEGEGRRTRKQAQLETPAETEVLEGLNSSENASALPRIPQRRNFPDLSRGPSHVEH